MGGEKTTQAGSTTQSYTMSPAEQEQVARLNRIGAATEQEQIGVNRAGLSAVNALLTGQNLPGYLKQLPYGISPEVTSNIVSESLRDVNAQLVGSGVGSFLESGSAQQAGVRTAGDIRNQAEQFNLQNLMQLLNVGVGGQASVQQPMLGYSGQLAGLVRGTGTMAGTSNTTTLGMNPFLKSFQTSAGSTLGGASFKAGPFGF